MAGSASHGEASLPRGPPPTPLLWCCWHTRGPGLGSADHQGAELGSCRVRAGSGLLCQHHNGQLTSLRRHGDIYDMAAQEGSLGGAQRWLLHSDGASGTERTRPEEMSSNMAVASEESPAAVKLAKIHFWKDGPATQSDYRTPEVTAKERLAVWNAVAVYVQQQLLLHKAVRIPTLGCFSIVSEEIETDDGTTTVQLPVFCLARNLAGINSWMEEEEFLSGHKEVEPLKYFEVAMAACVSPRTAKACIFSTTFLVSHCLKMGENVAFVLKDIGVLLIEGKRVRMNFYYDFLVRISGKGNLEKAIFKVPWLLDMVVSRMATAASLTPSGRVVVFPRFQKEFLPKPPPRKARRATAFRLPPLGQGKKGKFPEVPTLDSWIDATSTVETRSVKETRDGKRKASCQPSQEHFLPAIPKAASANKRPQEKMNGRRSTSGTYSAFPAVPLTDKGTRSLLSQPPKTNVWLSRQGMSSPH